MLLPASPRARARRGAPPSRGRLKRPLRAGTAHVRRRAPARPPPSSPTAPQLTHRAPASAACVAGRAGGRSPVQKRKRKTPPKTLSERKSGTGGRQREMFDGPGYGWVRTLGVFALWPAKTRTHTVRFFFRGASCGPQQAALALPSRLSPPAALGPWRPRGSAAVAQRARPSQGEGGGVRRGGRDLAARGGWAICEAARGRDGRGWRERLASFFSCGAETVALRYRACGTQARRGEGVSSEGERVALRERRTKVAVRHPVAPVEVGLP